jgi:hypothetical protein
MRILLSWRGWLRVGDVLVDRLRLVNPYSGSQVLKVCCDAANEIERLRYEMERFAVALDDISHLTTDHQVLHRIGEARRG